MQTHSHIVSVLNQGLMLDVALGDLDFTAYVVVSQPNLDVIADIIPQENYDRHGNVHVAAIATADEVGAQISDIAFNMDNGDAAVFLCEDDSAYLATLHELGQPATGQPS
ncbi:MAG TPA: hypothetical protein VKZ71_05105 [Burkholderiaceae bacterium]|nr:hypothetical protein [Burkholderiaceae bacterium]